MTVMGENKAGFRSALERFKKRFLPRGLFGRTLLIIVTPTILALAVATFVFFDRHWYTMTLRLSTAVAGDVSTIVELLRDNDTPSGRKAVIDLAHDKMDLVVTYKPEIKLNKAVSTRGNPLRAMLKRALEERLHGLPFAVEFKPDLNQVSVDVEVPKGVYRLVLPERRIYTPTTEVFIAWMLGSSILLSLIALLFMRNQIRPIRRLAEAAEDIGKGRDVPWYKLEGASEVRQAGAALLVMHDRLRRQITQRTAMLAGVSHDLRTPLTRMKLQLALMPDSDATQELKADIADMEGMVEAYLAFARGEEAEPAVAVDLRNFLEEIVAGARRQHAQISLDVPTNQAITIKRNAMKRCLSNLISNALRYAKRAEVTALLREHAIDVIIDDNGPGIPSEKREDVFRPFLRLDESRNPTTGGVGLGLTIARDIARAHGGDVVLEHSPLGGLRARVWIPV